MSHTAESGRAGEQIAAGFLRGLGYRILAENFRVRYGEIDLIAKQGDMLVFVEVKTRRSDRFASPGESVTARKQARLRDAASLWLSEHGGESPSRFDVIEVILGLSDKAPRIHHIENAFV